MKRCIILTSLLEGRVTDLITPVAEDLILCADGGFSHALEQGIRTDVVLGDMDSLEETGFDPSEIPPGIRVVRSPRAKDRTDTGLCLEYALESGCSEAVVLGGLGGRLDHTLANLQDAAAFCARGLSVSFRDRDVRAWFVTDGTLWIDPLPEFSLSVFAWSPQARGVSLRNVEYPLSGHTLETGFPLGVSNGFALGPAEVSVEKGTLLVLCARLRGLDKAGQPGI